MNEPVAEIAIKYLNRLSDYLFLWRLENCPLMSLNSYGKIVISAN
jgi:hypothetical protein